MPSSVARTLLAILATLACSFAILCLCVAPLAWILRDGLRLRLDREFRVGCAGEDVLTFLLGNAMLISSALLAGSLIFRRRLIPTKPDANNHEGSIITA